jgi:hypothetical protein
MKRALSNLQQQVKEMECLLDESEREPIAGMGAPVAWQSQKYKKIWIYQVVAEPRRAKGKIILGSYSDYKSACLMLSDHFTHHWPLSAFDLRVECTETEVPDDDFSSPVT